MEEEQDDFGLELSFTGPPLTFDPDAEGLEGFGQAEAALAGVGVQEEPKYEWLVEFALASDHIRADNFHPQQAIATLRKFGLPVAYQTEWITLMAAGDKDSFMKGVRHLSKWVGWYEKDIDRTKADSKLERALASDNIDETTQTLGAWYTPADEVQEVLKIKAPEFIHHMAVVAKPAPGAKRTAEDVEFYERTKAPMMPIPETPMMAKLPIITEEAAKRKFEKLPKITEKKEAALGTRAKAKRKEQDDLVKQRFGSDLKRVQQLWMAKAERIQQGGYLQKENMLQLIKYLQIIPGEGDPWKNTAKNIIDVVMKTDKFYGQQAKRYKRVFNPGERKKELEAALLSDSGGSHKVKTIEYLSAILKEYDEAEKYLATRPQAPAPAQPAQAQGLRKNPPVRKMKAQAQMTDAEKEYYRKTEIGFAAVGKYVNTAFGVKNLFKNAKGHRRFARKARDILIQNGVDPVGLFKKFGKANYLSFGQGSAIAKTAKIFGMNQKSKAWRGKNYINFNM